MGRGRPWGLRRRLTFAFAVVALAAVGLTVWLTLGALFQAQRELFDPGAPHWWPPAPDRPDSPFGSGQGPPWEDRGFAAARDAFRGVARTAVLAATLSFLLALVAASLVARFLTRPLVALTRGAERLGAGERGIRLRIPRSQDELGRLTEAFNDLVAGLERQEAWRRDMVADVAHDLRTPLAVLRSEIEAMQDGVRNLDAAGLDRLHVEVMMMARLVDDLRTLSLAESGALGLECRETPLGPFLEGVARSFAGRAAEAEVELRVAPPPEGVIAHFDGQRVRRILGNLVDNALRHGGRGPVEVGGRGADGGVTLWVRDHGPGISEEALQRVFERFYRHDRSRSRGGSPGSEESGGSGLGLAIAKALAEAHGGRIEASNHDGGGAVFSVWLPRCPRDPGG